MQAHSGLTWARQMNEIMTPVYTFQDDQGDECFIVTGDHTWSDLVRYLMRNRPGAEEVHCLLGEALGANAIENGEPWKDGNG